MKDTWYSNRNSNTVLYNCDNLLYVCSYEQHKCCLVALNCNDCLSSEHFLQPELTQPEPEVISCAMNDSRVLIGAFDSFRKLKDQRFELIHRISIIEQYCSFAASSGIDTLVAMCYQTDTAKSSPA